VNTSSRMPSCARHDTRCARGTPPDSAASIA
jgi:hypothetical protein